MTLAFSMPPSIFSTRSAVTLLTVGSAYFQNISSRMTKQIVPHRMSYDAGMSGFGSSDATMMMVSMALPDQPRGSA